MIYLTYGAWSYDPAECVISTPLAAIPICTQASPRVGAFFVSRRGEDAWMISPAKCHTNGAWFIARPAYIGIYHEFVYLSGAPQFVNDQIAELYL